METSEEYIWLFDRKEYGELAGSILGSILFHALMFAILASTTIFHPLPGESDRVDVLWYYPSMSPGNRAAHVEKALSPVAVKSEPQQQRPPAAAAIPAKSLQTQATPAKSITHERAAEITTPPPPPKSTAAAETAHPLITVPEEEPETETEPEMVIPAAIEPPPDSKATPKTEKPAEKKVVEAENIRVAAPKAQPAAEERKKPAAPSTGKETPIKEVKPVLPASPPVAGEPLRSLVAKGVVTAATTAIAGNPVAAQAARTHVETPTATEAQTGQARTALPSSPLAAATVTGQPKGSERKGTAVALQGGPRAAGIAGEAKSPGAGKEAKAASPAKTAIETKQSEKKQFGAPEAKGIFLPPVTGDLKLEMSGKDELLQRLKVVVLFREYPRTRRNRPLSRAEFRRAKTLTPRLVRSGETSRQAVIEVAGEGIYEFMVESTSEQPETVEFALKLYEKSTKARTKPLGARQIAHSESVVKVLMPEGILWSEDAAFSGSIEDSDGVTKFNTDTGLLWREYKQP